MKVSIDADDESVYITLKRNKIPHQIISLDTDNPKKVKAFMKKFKKYKGT